MKYIEHIFSAIFYIFLYVITIPIGLTMILVCLFSMGKIGGLYTIEEVLRYIREELIDHTVEQFKK